MPTLTQAQFDILLSQTPVGVKMELIKSPTGQLIVTTEKTKADILKERYGHLIGRPITVSDAAKKYDVLRGTIHKWRQKGYISTIEPGYQMTVNEAEVAYCVDTYRDQQAKGMVRGTPLFNGDGLPYELKHPELSTYRRLKQK